MKYIKKPIPVEAVQILYDEIEIISNYPTWFINAFYSGKISYVHNYYGLIIETLEGRMFAPFGSYIIRGVDGEIYPCRKDIFEKTYEVYEE